VQEKINVKFYKELLFPVFCDLGAFVLLLALSQTDEVGGRMTLILIILLMAMSGLFTCLAIVNREKSLRRCQELYSHFPELEKDFQLIYSNSRYARESLSLYLYKDAIIRVDAYFQFLRLSDLADVTIKIEEVEQTNHLKIHYLYLYYNPMSSNKDIRLAFGPYTDQKYIDLLQFLDVMNQVAPRIRIYNEAVEK
jgi:hypothetical protein